MPLNCDPPSNLSESIPQFTSRYYSHLNQTTLLKLPKFMAILFVNKNLKIVSYAVAGYQFKGTRDECEEYVELALQRLTPEESREKELEFLRKRGGEKLVESIFGKAWEEKRKQYDKNWDKIRRSRNKRAKKENDEQES